MLKGSDLLWLSIIILSIHGSIQAQPAATSPLTRRALQEINFPAGYDVVTLEARSAAGTRGGRHSHPKVDTGYVLEGSGTLLVEGRPDRALAKGDSYAIDFGVPHDVLAGPDGLQVHAVYVVERGKPRASSVPDAVPASGNAK